MADPNTLFIPTDARVILPNGMINPQWWRYFQELQTGLTTIDLSAQVTGVLPLINGGTGDTDGTHASALVGTTLASNVVASSLTSLGTLAALIVTGTITGMSDLYTAAYTDYTTSSTITGWSSFTAGRKGVFYKQVGKTYYVYFHLEGTSNSVGTSFTLPSSSRATPTGSYGFGSLMMQTVDNGGFLGPGVVGMSAAGSSTATCYSTQAGGAWTNSGTKVVNGQFWYETS